MPELRLGIAGCGRVVERFHMPALRRSGRWSVRALADASPDRLTTLAGMAPDASLWTDGLEMIAQADLDGLLVATPPDQHVELTLAGLQAGLHVLVEKPGGRSAADAERMAAAAGDRVAWVGYNRRFRASYGRLRDWLRDREPMVPIQAECSMAFWAEAWESVGGHLGDPARGGSVLMDVASHQLDLLPWLLDEQPSEIKPITWDDRGGFEGLIRYRMVMPSGSSIDCLAAHRPGYTETLGLKCEGVQWLAHPTGLLRSGRRDLSSLERQARVSGWVRRELIRLGVLPDPLAHSFIRQWRAFADQIQGQAPEVSGTTLAEAVALHARLGALRQDAFQPNAAWVAAAF